MEEAWFFKSGGGWRPYYNLLYLPYSAMVLSYVVIGAAIAPEIHYDRLGSALVAYFLGVGLAAHYLNEATNGRAGTKISRRGLLTISLSALAIALFIGVYYALTVTILLLLFILAETFFLFAYNMRSFMNGKFHTDFWFALSWGSLPVLTSYFVNALTITPSSLLMSAVTGLTAGIQARLSRWLKEWRRRSQLNGLLFRSYDGDTPPVKNYDIHRLIWRPESALKILVLTVNLLAIAMLLSRLAF